VAIRPPALRVDNPRGVHFIQALKRRACIKLARGCIEYLILYTKEIRSYIIYELQYYFKKGIRMNPQRLVIILMLIFKEWLMILLEESRTLR
jgi:hypothetical protein